MHPPTSRVISILNEIRALTASTHSGWTNTQALSALSQTHTLAIHALSLLEGEQLMPTPTRPDADQLLTQALEDLEEWNVPSHAIHHIEDAVNYLVGRPVPARPQPTSIRNALAALLAAEDLGAPEHVIQELDDNLKALRARTRKDTDADG